MSLKADSRHFSANDCSKPGGIGKVYVQAKYHLKSCAAKARPLTAINRLSHLQAQPQENPTQKANGFTIAMQKL